MVCKGFDKLLGVRSGLDSSKALDGFRLPWFGDVGFALCLWYVKPQTHNTMQSIFPKSYIDQGLSCILFVPFLFAFVMA